MSRPHGPRAASSSSTRLATASDLEAIAKIHKTAYSRNHFTALLPEDVLMRYYGSFLSGGTEIRLALDPEPDAVAQGFSVYGVGIPEKIAAFKKAFAKEILRTSLQHPWLSTRKALRAVRSKLDKQAPYSPADFLLLSIAVARPSGGVGKRLLNEVVASARNGGHRTVGLYVNEDNIRAINAYFLSGFRIKEFRDGQYYMEADTEA